MVTCPAVWRCASTVDISIILSPMAQPKAFPRDSSSVVTVRRPDSAVWQHSLRLADGDPRRLEVLEDGTVVVHNTRIR
jgi:hypothetical protein